MDFSLEEHMLPCLSKRYFGFDCPGCGLQRSMLHLLHGDFASAFALYPPVFSLLILTVSTALFLFYKTALLRNIFIISGVVHALVTLTSYLYKIL